MSILQSTLLSNALLVVPLAIVVWIVTRFVQRPSLAWALWGLVLLKFVTPAVVSLPLETHWSHNDHLRSTGFQPVREDRASPSHEQRNPERTPRSATATEQFPVTQANEWPQDASVGITADTFGTRPMIHSSDALNSSHTSDISRTLVPPIRSPADAPLPQPGSVTDDIRPADDGETTASTAASLSIVWGQLAWSVWLAGSVMALAIAMWRIVRFRLLLRAAVPAGDDILDEARQLASRLGLRRLPAIGVIAGRVPPLVWAGPFRARVLLPSGLLSSLDAEGRRTLLAHELSHLVRRDHWTRWLELTVRCIYWWHPVAWFAALRLREAEEQCCDARVVSLLPESAAAYAHTILTTVEFLTSEARPVPTLATGLEPLRRSVRPLHRRLHMIVHEKPAPRSSWLMRLLVIGFAAIVLPAALITQAGGDEPEEPAPRAIEFAVPAIQKKAGEPLPFSFYIGFAETPSDDPAVETSIPEAFRTQPSPLPSVQSSQADVPEEFRTKPRPVEKRSRPKASPVDYEEITVVARDYEMKMSIRRAYEQFLKSIEPAFPVLVTSFSGQAIREGMMGNPLEATNLRIVTSPEAQEALGAFIKAMKMTESPDADAEKLTLARARYAVPTTESPAFVELLRSYHQAGVISPLVVRMEGDQISVTTYKSVHEHIRKLVGFLNQHIATEEQTSAPDSPVPISVKQRPGSSLDLSERPHQESDQSQDNNEELLKKLYRIDASLRNVGREKLLRVIGNRAKPSDPAQLDEAKRSAAEDLMPLLKRERELTEKHGPYHPDVKRIQEIIVTVRASQLQRLGPSKSVPIMDKQLQDWVHAHEELVESETALEQILQPFEVYIEKADRMTLLQEILDRLKGVIAMVHSHQRGEPAVDLYSLVEKIKAEESLRSEKGVQHPDVQNARKELHKTLQNWRGTDVEDSPATDYFDVFIKSVRQKLVIVKNERTQLEAEILTSAMGNDDSSPSDRERTSH